MQLQEVMISEIRGRNSAGHPATVGFAPADNRKQ